MTGSQRLRLAVCALIASTTGSCGALGGDGAIAAPTETRFLTTTTITPETTPADDVAGFCEIAVPIVDGRVPTEGDLQTLLQLSGETLVPDERTDIESEVAILVESLEAGEWSQGEDMAPYNTGPLVVVVENLCGVTLHWMAGTP